MTGETDRELWPRIQEGDPDAFAVVFDRYARDVYNFVFRRTASWDLAEEMTSAVFLEAWRRRREFTPEHETLRPWLFGVAGNLLRNSSRSLRRRVAAEGRLQPEDSPDFADDLASKIDDETLMRRTLEVFGALAAHEQDVLGLAVWEALSYEDISIALAIPVGTVRSRIHRARQHLAELLRAGGHGWDADTTESFSDREGTAR
jgi:RNA polymerase sigma factor (sigma-70 family)